MLSTPKAARTGLLGLALLAGCGSQPQEVASPPVAPPPPVVQKPKVDPDIQAALEGLKYPDPVVRHDSAILLVNKGTRAVGPLIDALGSTTITATKIEIVWALSMIGDARAIAPLAAALDDKDESVRRQAADALLGFQTAAVDPLIGALASTSPQVREAAAVLLGEIKDPRAITPLIKAMWNTEQAPEAVGGFGKAALGGLLGALKGGDVKTKAGAAYALGKMAAEEATNPLIALLGEWDPSVVRASAEALGKIGAKKALPGIAELLDHHNPLVRAAAVQAIGRIGSFTDAAPIVALLSDDHQLVQHNAITTLGELGIPSSAEPLASLLEEDDKWVPYLAAEALALIGEPSVEHLVKATSSENSLVRSLAAEALGKIGGKAAIKALVGLLSDEEVSSTAVLALVEVGFPAIEPLVKSLSSKNPSVRESAMEALREITGFDLGDDPAAWKKLPELL